MQFVTVGKAYLRATGIQRKLGVTTHFSEIIKNNNNSKKL